MRLRLRRLRRAHRERVLASARERGGQLPHSGVEIRALDVCDLTTDRVRSTSNPPIRFPRQGHAPAPSRFAIAKVRTDVLSSVVEGPEVLDRERYKPDPQLEGERIW